MIHFMILDTGITIHLFESLSPPKFVYTLLYLLKFFFMQEFKKKKKHRKGR